MKKDVCVATTELSEPTLQLAWERSLGPWLVEVGNGQENLSSVISTGERLVLGSGSLADLRVEDCAVSARHCSVSIATDGPVVEDLGSLNGTLLGEARIASAKLPAQTVSFVIGHSIVVVRPLESGEIDCSSFALPRIVGGSSCMRRLARDVHRIAPLRASVLIQGESGTGKDLVARAIHELSGRAGPFVPMNMGAIAENLVEAELFGHRKGAFTGAMESRTGAFEQAHRGTLFLDEVAELSPAGQVKLLRVVEDGCVRPVGGSQTLCVDVRVVSATWAPLRTKVTGRMFREDLYHRLSVFLVELPPLRERKADLPALCELLLRRANAEVGPKRLSGAALAKLSAYDWPGNVRELQAVLYRAAVQCVGEEIQAPDVVTTFGSSRSRRAHLSGGEAVELLARHQGNLSAAARAAGVPRSTFRFWVDRGRRDQSVII